MRIATSHLLPITCPKMATGNVFPQPTRGVVNHDGGPKGKITSWKPGAPILKKQPSKNEKIKRFAPKDLITERSGANRELVDSRDDVDGQSPELEASAPARSLFSIHSTPIRKIDSKDNKRCQTPSRGTGRLVTHSPLRVHSVMPIQSAV